MSFQVHWLLILALVLPNPHGAHAGLSIGPTAAEEPTEDDMGLCGVARRAMQEKIEEAKKELGKSLYHKPRLNDCAKAFTEHYDSCSNPAELARFGCKSEGERKKQNASAPDAAKGIPQAADKMAAGLVEDANCKRLVENCLTKGMDRDGSKSEQKIWDRCLKGDKLSFSQDSDPNTPRGRDMNARNELLYRVHKASTKYKECLKNRAQLAEDLARETLLNSEAARSDGSRPTLTCIEKVEGHRVCEVSKDGERFKPADRESENGPVRDPEVDRDNPVRLGGKDSGCSGTLLGDGQTVVTAGHCLGDGSRRGERQITVRDSLGNEHTVAAQCSGVFGGVGYSDLAKCSLSQPIKANPVYFATYDPTVRGANCVEEGYLKRCGSEFFQNLTNRPVTLSGYPANYGLMQSTGTITGTGTNGWIWQNGLLYHDLPCTAGCSGSGYIVDIGGQRVVVGAHSYGYVYGMGGGGSVPTYRQWQGLRIQSISTDKLANSSLFFQQIQ